MKDDLDAGSASPVLQGRVSDYLMHHMRATALIPASEVFMFSVVENWPRGETHEKQRAGEEIP